MKNKLNHCLKNIEQICEALGEELDSESCLEIKQHLEKCPHCCAYVDSIKKTIYLYQNLVDEDVPQNVDEKLWKI